MKRRADRWQADAYPFGSEMAWDSTGQEEIFAWTNYFGYKDKAAASDGIAKISYGAGDPGKGKAGASGANNSAKGQSSLPTGLVGMLSGNLNPTIQLVTSDGLCIGSTMTEVTRDDSAQYKARKK